VQYIGSNIYRSHAHWPYFYFSNFGYWLCFITAKVLCVQAYQWR